MQSLSLESRFFRKCLCAGAVAAAYYRTVMRIAAVVVVLIVVAASWHNGLMMEDPNSLLLVLYRGNYGVSRPFPMGWPGLWAIER